MSIIEIIKFFVTQLCLQPVLLVICLPALFIGFNIFTLKATTERIRHQAVNDLQSYGMRDPLIKILADPELFVEMRYLVIQSLERLGDHPLVIREYRTLAQADSAALKNRVDAAVALARLDQSDSTYELLLLLTSHPERDSQLRTKLAWALQQAGWRDEASQVLA